MIQEDGVDVAPPRGAELRSETPARKTYDRDKHVFARLVGTQRARLSMADERGRSGVDRLDRFKITRLRQLGPKAGDHGQ